MRPDDQQKAGTVVMGVIAASVVLLLLQLLCGCTTTRYVPVESVRTEYREVDTTAIYNRLLRLFESRRENTSRIDSLIDREKETVVLKENGDTARHDRERVVYVSSKREKELEHRVTEQDSVINALRTQLSSVKVDSIPVPYPVEKPLTRWQQAKMDFGGAAMGGVAFAVCFAVVWLSKKFRK